MTVPRFLASATAAVVSTALLAATGVSAIPTQAASGCPQTGPTVTAPDGKQWHTFMCTNVQNAPIYTAPWYSSDSKQDSYMSSTWSWFVCKIDSGGSNGEGSPHPHRWLWTEGDNGQWGWMSDADISNETNPVSNCPTLHTFHSGDTTYVVPD